MSEPDGIEAGVGAQDDHGHAQLTEDEVEEIRDRYAEGNVLQTDLADEFGVERANISYIIRGETWPDAPGPVQDPLDMVGGDHPMAKLTEDEVEEIRDRYAEGNVLQPVLADEFGVERRTIGYIIRGETWPDAPGPVKGEDYEWIEPSTEWA